MLESLWGRMLISLATKVPPAALDSWLRPCRLTAVEGDHVKIAAPNTYTRDWLHQHHTESLQAAAREVRITGLDRFVPVGLGVVHLLGANAANEQILIGPRQTGKQDGGPQLGHAASGMRQR